MTEPVKKKPPLNKDRSQKPLWYAIGGLVVCLFSFSFRDHQIGVVVFWFGGVFAVTALLYWFVQPKHGLPPGK